MLTWPTKVKIKSTSCIQTVVLLSSYCKSWDEIRPSTLYLIENSLSNHHSHFIKESKELINYLLDICLFEYKVCVMSTRTPMC